MTLYNGQTFTSVFQGGTLAVVRGQAAPKAGELRIAYAIGRDGRRETYAGALNDLALAQIRPDIGLTPEKLISIMIDNQPEVESGFDYVDLCWEFLTARLNGSFEEFQTQLNQLSGADRTKYKLERECEIVAVTFRLPTSSNYSPLLPASIVSACARPPAAIAHPVETSQDLDQPPAEEKNAPPPAEEKKTSPVAVTLDVDEVVDHEGDDPHWMLKFRVELASGFITKYVVQYPNHTPLAKWRALARGEVGIVVGDLNDDNGTIAIKGTNCKFSTGTNCRDTTKTSAMTTVPHAWIAGPLNGALDEAVRRQLPFAA